MDPLSLISSCVSIVQAIEALYKITSENVHSTTVVRSQLGALIAKCLACKGIIEGIKLQIELDKEDKSRLLLLEHVSAPIRALETAINLITTKLRSLPRHIVFGKIIGGSLDECMKTFDETLRILQLALQADQLAVTRQIFEHVNSIESDVRLLGAAVEKLTDDLAELSLSAAQFTQSQRSLEEETVRRELSAWLSNVDVAQLHQVLAEKTHPGTGTWFLDKIFAGWLQHTMDSQRVLWLQGKSGSGKSTLVTSAVTHMAANENAPSFAYFFCSVSLSDTRSLVNILGSFVLQLCHKKPELWHYLRAWRDNLVSRPQDSLSKPQPDDLGRLLTDMCKNFDSVVLILDAPNECSENPRRLLSIMGSILRRAPTTRIFLSSTRDLDHSLLGYDDTFLVDMSISGVNSDIYECIRARLDSEDQLIEFPQHLKDEVLGSIVSRADGSFRFAECQLSAVIDNAMSPAEVKHALSNLSSSLEELYTAILMTIPARQARFVKRALTWLALAVRTLRLDELREAMVLEEGFTRVDSSDRLLPGIAENLLARCCILMNYDAGNKLISLAHSSVRDFLTSDACRVGEARYFHLDVVDCYSSLSCLAVGYLSQDTLATGPCTSKTDYLKRLKHHPLLFYASEAWPILAARAAWNTDSNRDSLENIFKSFFDSSANQRGGNFGSWIQLYEPRHFGFRLSFAKNPPLSTPLYYAARSGMVEVADMIIRIYGKATLETPGGSKASTPLHVAAAYGRSAVVKLLLDHGANPNEQNGWGQRGLGWADRHGYENIVQLYLEHGAEPLTEYDRAMIRR